MFPGGQQAIPLIHPVKQLHLFARTQQALGFHPYPRPCVNFVQMADMGFHGKVTAARGDVIGVATDDFHKAVGGIAKNL